MKKRTLAALGCCFMLFISMIPKGVLALNPELFETTTVAAPENSVKNWAVNIRPTAAVDVPAKKSVYGAGLAVAYKWTDISVFFLRAPYLKTNAFGLEIGSSWKGDVFYIRGFGLIGDFTAGSDKIEPGIGFDAGFSDRMKKTRIWVDPAIRVEYLPDRFDGRVGGHFSDLTIGLVFPLGFRF